MGVVLMKNKYTKCAQNYKYKAGGPNKSSQCYVKIICLFLCNHALDLVKNGVKLKIFQSIFDL